MHVTCEHESAMQIFAAGCDVTPYTKTVMLNIYLLLCTLRIPKSRYGSINNNREFRTTGSIYHQFNGLTIHSNSLYFVYRKRFTGMYVPSTPTMTSQNVTAQTCRRNLSSGANTLLTDTCVDSFVVNSSLLQFVNRPAHICLHLSGSSYERPENSVSVNTQTD